MALDAHAALCERVYAHCREQHWYGPDDLRLPLDFRPRDPQFDGFELPPATEDELREAEQQLGFRLPPALRTLYMLVANGGFGPGFGILGVPTIAKTLTRGNWRISESTAQHLEQCPNECLTCEDEPAGLLTLCIWEINDGTFSKVDSATGRIYSVLHNVEAPEPTWERAIVVQYQARSLEDWLERWLRGDLNPYREDENELLDRSNSLEEGDCVVEFEPSEEDWRWYVQHIAFDARSFND